MSDSERTQRIHPVPRRDAPARTVEQDWTSTGWAREGWPVTDKDKEGK